MFLDGVRGETSWRTVLILLRRALHTHIAWSMFLVGQAYTVCGATCYWLPWRLLLIRFNAFDISKNIYQPHLDV